jgi:hypothetical protein
MFGKLLTQTRRHLLAWIQRALQCNSLLILASLHIPSLGSSTCVGVEPEMQTKTSYVNKKESLK